jgi:Inorganic H+ pyrophosphatase
LLFARPSPLTFDEWSVFKKNETLSHTCVSNSLYFSALSLQAKFIFFPLIVHAMDIIVSSVGIAFVGVTRDSADADPMKALQRGYRVALLLSVVGFYIITHVLLHVPESPGASFNFFLCGLVGMACAYIIVLSTQVCASKIILYETTTSVSCALFFFVFFLHHSVHVTNDNHSTIPTMPTVLSKALPKRQRPVMVPTLSSVLVLE